MAAKTNIFRGTLLVAGTSIGGGMLALPVLTSLTGFLPSMLVYLLCWLFMATTGLLLLEICLWMEDGVNLRTMAERTLGVYGKYAAWILYLFLFYCLTLAYIVGCGDLVVEALQGTIPEWVGSLVFVLLFAPLIFAGAHLAGRINVWLMLGLAVTYCAFVFLGYRHVNPELWKFRDWSYFPMAFPIAFTAFAYQGIIPTLVTYMHREPNHSRIAIMIGSFLPFIVYIIWQALIMGIVPTHGPGGLAEALENGDNAVQPLKHFLQSSSVYIIGQFFAFFALVTSFLGVTLGLFDFLADGLSVKKTPSGKALLCFLIFVPPLIVSFTNPGLFLMALDFAGGFGCSLLLGLMPVLMVWAGRYYLGYESTFRVPGGKSLLIVLIAFVVFVLACQFYVMS
jgi:tyrosine-specific transport protein